MALLTKMLQRGLGADDPMPETPRPPTLEERARLRPGVMAFLRATDAHDADAARAAFRAAPTCAERALCVDGVLHDDDDTWLEHWRAAHPAEALPALIQGSVLMRRGWAARGSGRADTVSDDGFRTFFDCLRRADRLLLDAGRLDAGSPVPWSLLLATGKGLQIPLEEITFRFDEALRADPTSLAAHRHYVQAIAGKWSGTDEQMWDFAMAVHGHVPAGSPVRAVVADAAVERFVISGSDRTMAAENDVVEAARQSIWHPEFENHQCVIEQVGAVACFVEAFYLLDMDAELRQTSAVAHRLPHLGEISYIGRVGMSDDERWELVRSRIS